MESTASVGREEGTQIFRILARAPPVSAVTERLEKSVRSLYLHVCRNWVWLCGRVLACLLCTRLWIPALGRRKSREEEGEGGGGGRGRSQTSQARTKHKDESVHRALTRH